MIGDILSFISNRFSNDPTEKTDRSMIDDDSTVIESKTNDSMTRPTRPNQRSNKLFCSCPKPANADIFCSRANAWFESTMSRRKSHESLQAQYSKLKKLYKQLLNEQLDEDSNA
jgi:hypothetical protein